MSAPYRHTNARDTSPFPDKAHGKSALRVRKAPCPYRKPCGNRHPRAPRSLPRTARAVRAHSPAALRRDRSSTKSPQRYRQACRQNQKLPAASLSFLLFMCDVILEAPLGRGKHALKHANLFAFGFRNPVYIHGQSGVFQFFSAVHPVHPFQYLIVA